MAPNFIMVAVSAICRTFPCIFPALYKYFLENNRNIAYHVSSRIFVVGSLWTLFVWGDEVFPNFISHFFDIKKGLPKETNKLAKYN